MLKCETINLTDVQKKCLIRRMRFSLTHETNFQTAPVSPSARPNNATAQQTSRDVNEREENRKKKKKKQKTHSRCREGVRFGVPGPSFPNSPTIYTRQEVCIHSNLIWHHHGQICMYQMYQDLLFNHPG